MPLSPLINPDARGLALGLAVDAAIGDPRKGHPVAAFGVVAGRLESVLWRDSRSAGALYCGVCVAGPVLLGVAALRLPARTTAVAVATWAVVGGTTLGREADAISAALARGDLDEARRRLPALVGRDPSSLSPDEVARAVVESVAENTADAVVAPLFWGAVLGLPGLLGYRAVNTLDAMVGHRSARYERFGWASARLDDVANWVPARLTALLAVALSPCVGGSPVSTWEVLRRDGGRHPSPNSGRCEAAFAGAMDVTLGGRNDYAGRVEHRPLMGSGKPVSRRRHRPRRPPGHGGRADRRRTRRPCHWPDCCPAASVSGALLVAGTTSDAGKSVVTAGLCRWLVREGVSVAPFKAQNMSNNSAVTLDGAEIGRAQAMQAAAARVEPEAAMNPVLLKPGSDRVSHVVVMGQPVGEVDAMGYREWKPKLLEVALSALADLRSRFDVVICEGAGSPTEINLRGSDIANMGLAVAAVDAGRRRGRHRPWGSLRFAVRDPRADAAGRPGARRGVRGQQVPR